MTWLGVVLGGSERKLRNRPVLQGFAVQGCSSSASPQAPGCRFGEPPTEGAGEPALPKAAFRPQSDCLWPRGMAETGTKIPLGESLSAYLQTRVRTPRRQGDVSKRTPKVARIREAFF